MRNAINNFLLYENDLVEIITVKWSGIPLTTTTTTTPYNVILSRTKQSGGQADNKQ